MTAALRTAKRCAIYTRKSTDAGLEQEFNSLDAQREAAEAYIKSQAHEGWVALPDHFDDGGFSGGSIERPGLQALLDRVRRGDVDCIIVYKIDRLTRSLADFARLVDLFDKHAVSFVSVTQQFNTTNSMGRLTLNVLLSFAQFEREVTAERIRDKIAATKRKGLRSGGLAPIGYNIENKRLVINEREADTVRLIFERYLDLQSISRLADELDRREIRTKVTKRRDGSDRGGGAFRAGPLAWLLRNRVYLGEVGHKGNWYKGEHPPIVDQEIFKATQQLLNQHARKKRAARIIEAPLADLIFDSAGNPMAPSSTTRDTKRYRYYVSRALPSDPLRPSAEVKRVQAGVIEEAVRETLRKLAISGTALPDEWDAPNDGHRFRAAIDRITVRKNLVELTLRPIGEAPPRILTVPWSPPNRLRKQIERPDGSGRDARPMRPETRARLIEATAKGRYWLGELLAGRLTSTQEIAKQQGLSERSIRMTINLAFFPPSIIEAAVEGQLPEACGVAKLGTLSSLVWGREMGGNAPD